MNEMQKLKIRELREEGAGYTSIAHVLGLTKSQVSSFCRRNNLLGARVQTNESHISHSGICPECLKPIVQRERTKKRRFCSSECRQKWWNSHQEQVVQKAVYSFECPTCGKEFSSYGNSKRKYCSHECYIKKRYGVKS